MKNYLLIFCLACYAFAQGQTTETFNYSGGIVTWTVPACVSSITISVKGAEGGYNSSSAISPGLGASMTGTFAVTPGQQFKLLVGQHPSSGSGNGGGGGSFVADMLNNPIIVAGGGGGSSQSTDSPMKHGQTTIAGGTGAAGGGNGGDMGNGGSIGSSGFQSGAGGGFYTNGADGWTGGTGGTAFVNGGFGAATNAPANGGFGGGGSGSSYVVGGGGGGYSGGGSGGNSSAGVGGGGGSFNSGTNQINLAGVNSGDGVITITYSIGAAAPVISGVTSVCGGTTGVTYSVVNDPAIASYTWTVSGGMNLVSGQGTNAIVVDAISGTGMVSVITTDNCAQTNGDTVEVMINAPSAGIDVQTACDNYTWIDGNTYYASNNSATYVLQNAAGCDSVVTLDLTINYSTSDTITTTECESYTLNGIDYTTSGTYIQNLQTMTGCDSTLVLNLTIVHASDSSLTETACGTYTLNGIDYTTSGTYIQNLQTMAGCDSTLTLNLTIVQPTTSELTLTGCDLYTLNGITYTASGTYIQNLQNAAGCDSTLTFNLTIVASPVANAVDNGDGTITASGGTGYQWMDCSTNLIIPGATNATFEPTVNGSYAVIVSENNCSDISDCITIDNLELSTNTMSSISVFPNPAKDMVTVQFAVPSANLVIRDAQGKQVKQLEVTSGDKIQMNDLVNGVYLFEFTSTEGRQIYSIIKQ